MQGQPRTSGSFRRSKAEMEFDRLAQAQSEAQVVNVSPFVARFEIATMPGSEPRRYKLEPGQTVHLQHGYTIEGKGAGREMVRPTIEANTEREAWPGERVEVEEGKFEWKRKPGPRLPMVCSVARARSLGDGRPGFGEQWRTALEKLQAIKAAPLRMTLRGGGGERVEVEAEVERDPREAVAHDSAPGEDVEDLDAPGEGDSEPPPPDDGDPDGFGEEPVELPSAANLPAPARETSLGHAPIPTRAARAPRGSKPKADGES